MTQYYAEITGWGKCLPPATLSNDDLSTFLDTSDEWIRSRTGIENRRISHVNTSEMATVAAKHALACAGISANEIDVLIVATCSPDSLIPNIASKVSQNLGMKAAAAFDLNAACTGFVYGLETATRLIQAGNYRNALVIGAERLSFFIDWTMRDTAVLFGDGAGAVVLSRTEQKAGLQSAQLGCDSAGRDILAVPKFGTSMDRFAADNGYWEFDFIGKEIFKRAVKGMGAAAQSVLSRSGLSTEEVDVVIPHQANIRIIQTLCDLSGISQEKAFVNIHKYGNTSAATVPIALCEALEQGKVKPNDDLLLAAFGAGLTWGAGHIKWGERVTPIGQSDAALPECPHSALELLANAIEHCKSKPE
ncbi:MULTISPECIES: ketoacyl-ACP synthase III [unclassified Vibrio]|uniref:ketoacyl-ACP synthase III n=1 Tax=unclassified Vibrio TaxID=2614977 RepID=UPI001360D501|nr:MULTISPECIES: ketoacyl-ACP synthase III [unclassified Vibrio]NAW56458.1 beta-ketoacyl-ACP synthase III [Vibrio sp. V36_P2S2PM302]NAX21742.1 beta-ketoacyl-ACP synthase III [Vibrio sp. V39_P1S14PM300]NAX27751.1 beta-ketoacyl-ACP synthase III [Vibrio sp. V38_P2S17PM301]NAX30893.1 beta-ketoacyl-ACP synthase III [Vibrio sp. V37_P2S8PM304]